MIKNINFVSKFKTANIASIIIFILSIFLITFKGLNYGIDFKGGTLIELRTEKSVSDSKIRDSLKSMDLGDINVKKFGKEGDYLIKVEQKSVNNNNLIPDIKRTLSENLSAEVDFRRVEKRLSNFLLWHLAYTELYFSDVYWPDFSDQHLQQALETFASRERRFGKESAKPVIQSNKKFQCAGAAQ